MKKIGWYVNRLKAMNLREIAWRIDQKRLQQTEKKHFGARRVNVGSEVWNPMLKNLYFNEGALGINFENKVYGLSTEIRLLKGLDYEKWPDTFSYSLEYKQRDDLGDARTNWEKNRHFDWALLAKAYYVSNDDNFLTKLQQMVDEWMNINPFLHGISWTSAMEFAIRSINWMFALAFIRKASGADTAALETKLTNGIINITEYLTKHYSRYSSANNHLLVEASAIGLAGFAFDYKPWKELACRILSEELEKQNYSDGVNKELSLHYQTFGMEAYLLLMHTIQKQDSKPICQKCEEWMPMLKKEAEFVAHSSWREKVVCEFGDDDEGRILDLEGADDANHQWMWVLQLASLIAGVRCASFERVCENTHWLFADEEIEKIKQKPIYDASKSRCFDVGGNSFLRDTENRLLIGIDHAALGFGTIAAHGHSDALSMQLYVDGKCFLGDPGTYIYHCMLKKRNEYRQTMNHNTVWADGKEQSQMMGAFLWGKKAETRLLKAQLSDDEDMIDAECKWIDGSLHHRCFRFNKKDCVVIKDEFKSESEGYATWMVHPDVEVDIEGNVSMLTREDIRVCVEAETSPIVEETSYSEEYGVERPSKKIVYKLNNNILTTKIWIEKY